MASLLTTQTRVHNAIKLVTEPYLYYVIARSSAWPDELNPPAPLVSDIAISEPIYFRRIQIKHLVYVNDPYSGDPIDVEVGGINYTYCLEAAAYTKLAYRVYLSETIDYSSISPSNVTFRNVSIVLNPKDAYGNLLTGLEYLPASVAYYTLLYENNRTYVTRTPEQTETIQTVIQF